MAILAVLGVEGVGALVSVPLALSSSLSFSFALSFLHSAFSWPSFRQYEHFLPLLAGLVLGLVFVMVLDVSSRFPHLTFTLVLV